MTCFKNLFFLSLLLSKTSMLLINVDLSGNIVGFGKHTLCNNKIIQLNGNMFIVKTKEDLSGYNDLQGACDVEITENEDMYVRI